MKFLENHPKVKLFFQCALSIGYFIFIIIQCSHTIDRNLPYPTPFIEAITVKFNFPNVANAIGFLYLVGGFTGFILIVITSQALTSVIKEAKSINSLFKE